MRKIFARARVMEEGIFDPLSWRLRRRLKYTTDTVRVVSSRFPFGLSSSTMGLSGEAASMQCNGSTAVAMNITERAAATIPDLLR